MQRNLTVVSSFRGSEAKLFPVPRILLSLGTGASVVVADWEYKLYSRQTSARIRKFKLDNMFRLIDNFLSS